MRLRRPTLTNHAQNPDTAPWTPTVQYVEIFACTGSMSSAAEVHGDEIAMLTEKEPVARGKLRRRFPDTAIYDDTGDDSEWSKFEHKPGAALGLLAGPPCQPFTPAGKGQMEGDPRARFLLKSVGDAVKKPRPETVDIEAVCNAAGAKDDTILQQLGDFITKHGYSRVVPDGGASPERTSSSHLGSVFDRTRLTVHYEQDNMGDEPLPMLPAEPVTGTKMD